MSTLQNPFVGLRPFESEDSLYYFGRNEQTKTLLRQLHEHRFVAVVGSSGSGKSSLIRAGLIPQLEAGFLVQDRDQWCVARLKPGDAPLGNLVGSLGALQHPQNGKHPHPLAPSPSQGEGGQRLFVENLVDAIRDQGTQAVVDMLEPLLRNTSNNLFILVDQFEELFRFGVGKEKSKADREEAEEFVALLLSLTRHELPVYVCLTMRSDFLGDCDAFYGLPEAINRSQFLVPRLTRQQRQEVITHPMHLAGAKMTPRLVDRLLNEGIDTRDDLPVLQHVLMRTWDVWAESGEAAADLTLDVSHYEEADTIHHALNSHADEALDELNERQQAIARRLFQALTAVDAGNRRIRRPVKLSEVAAIAEATPAEVMAVIDCFRKDGRAFLVLSADGLDDPLIDISHESLIRQWETLRAWVTEEAEAAKTYLRLVDSAERYKRDEGNLLRDAELAAALSWDEDYIPEKSSEVWAERYDQHYWAAIDFLNLSQRKEQERKEREQHQQAEKARLLEEKAELEKQQRLIAEQQAQEQQKTLVKFRRMIVVMAALVTILFTVTFFAWQAKQEAKNKEFKANQNLAKAFESNGLFLKSAKNNLTKSPQKKSFLSAMESIRFNKISKQLESRNSFLSNFDDIDLRFLTPQRYFTPNLHTKTIGISQKLYKEENILITNHTNHVKIWNYKEGTLIDKVSIRSEEITAYTYLVNKNSLVLGTNKGNILSWSLKSRKIIKETNAHRNEINILHSLKNGSQFISSALRNKKLDESGSLKLWESDSLNKIKTIPGHENSISVLTLSSNEKYIATASYDKEVKLWDLEKNTVIGSFSTGENHIHSLNFIENDDILLAGTYKTNEKTSSHAIELFWNLKEKKLSSKSKAAPPQSAFYYYYNDREGSLKKPYDISDVSLDNLGKRIFLSYKQNGVEVRSLDTGKVTKKIPQIGSTKFIKHLKRDNLLVVSKNNEISEWNIKSGNKISLIPNIGNVSCINYNRLKNILAFCTKEGANEGISFIKIWDFQRQKIINTFEVNSYSISDIDISKNGNLMVSSSSDDYIRLWSLEKNKVIRKEKSRNDSVDLAKFSTDGKAIAFAARNDNKIYLWNIENNETHLLFNENIGKIKSISFSPSEDSILISIGEKNHNSFAYIYTWDIKNKKISNVFEGHEGGVSKSLYNNDGSKVVSISKIDRTMRIWDAKPKERPTSFLAHNGAITSLKYSKNGKYIASSSKDGKVKIWDIRNHYKEKTLFGHTSSVLDIKFSPSSQQAASSSKDKTIKIWDVASGEVLHNLTGHKGTVKSVSYNADGTELASASYDKSIRLWNTENGELKKILKENSEWVTALAYSPANKRTLVSGGYDTKIRIWNTTTAKETAILEGHQGWISSIVFSPDGLFFASSSYDNTIIVWDIITKKNVLKISDYSGWVSALAFSPDGKKIIGSSKNGSIKIWDSKTGKELGVLHGDKDTISAISTTPNGKIVLSGSWKGKIDFWEPSSPSHRLLRDFDEDEVIDALSFIWRIKRYHDQFEFMQKEATPRLLPLKDYFFEYDLKFRPLLDAPRPDETKMDQLVRWLEDRKAYRKTPAGAPAE